MGKAHEIVIVGGGVIGCAIAYELATRGVKATVVERGPIGGEASWASAGIVSYPSRPAMLPARVELSRRSLARYPALVAALEERTGIGIDYVRPGELTIALDERQAALEAERAGWQQAHGFGVETVDAATARDLEPAVPDGVLAGWWSAGVGSLSAHRLTLALAAAAALDGARFLTGTPAAALRRDGNRVTGVRLADRDLSADTVVLAAGAWTRLLDTGLPVPLPTKPIKGQLIAFANAPVRPHRLITGHGGYVRPRPDGTTMVAATQEDVGFDRRVTGEGIAWLLDLTRTICPGLLLGEVSETWTGLRPGTERGEPMIGPVPGVDGLWVASGHFRTGINEAPATGELVADGLVTGRSDPLLAAFAPPAAPR